MKAETDFKCDQGLRKVSLVKAREVGKRVNRR
jgi:hypothetical protein